MYQVSHIMRRPQGENNYSIEGMFASVRAPLLSDIDVRVHVAPCQSRALVRRLANSAWALRLREIASHTLQATSRMSHDCSLHVPYHNPRCRLGKENRVVEDALCNVLDEPSCSGGCGGHD